MAKTLQRVGNSLGLIIEAPLRRALGIGTKTKLSMRTDGRRLIIEPLPEVFEREADPDEERLKLDAKAVARRLMGWFAMSPEHIQQLYPGLSHYIMYPTNADGWGMGRAASGDDVQTMRRMEACLLAKEANKSWEDAIADALQRWPVTCRDSPKS